MSAFHFLLFSTIIFAAGCASLPFMKKTIEPKSQYKLEQATLSSPDEPGWSLMQHQMHSAVFAKNIADGSAIVSANMYKVGMFKTSREFLQYIAKQREQNDDKTRFKVLTVDNDYVTFKGLPCLKYKTLAEDHKNNGIDSANFEYFKTSGYICRYPLEYIAFQIEASHRSAKKEMPEELLKASQDFFNNIELVEPTIKRLKTIK